MCTHKHANNATLTSGLPCEQLELSIATKVNLNTLAIELELNRKRMARHCLH